MLAGAVLSQLMHLLLLNIARGPGNLGAWALSTNITVYLFLAAWGILLLRNVIRIFRSDPMRDPPAPLG